MGLSEKSLYLKLKGIDAGPDPLPLTDFDTFYVTFEAKAKPPSGYDSYGLETNLTVCLEEEDCLTIIHDWANLGGAWELFGIGWTGKWNVSPIFADPCDVRKVCGPQRNNPVAEAGDYTWSLVVGLYGELEGQKVILDSIRLEGTLGTISYG